MTDRPDSGAAVEQEPPSGASDDEFWRLAKKGLAAWGHEPTTEEIVDFWQGLVDDQRREHAAPALDPLASLALPAHPTTTPPDAAIARLASLLTLRRPTAAPLGDLPPDAAIARLASLLTLRRPTAAPVTVPAAPLGDLPPDAAIARLASLLTRRRSESLDAPADLSEGPDQPRSAEPAPPKATPSRDDLPDVPPALLALDAPIGIRRAAPDLAPGSVRAGDRADVHRPVEAPVAEVARSGGGLPGMASARLTPVVPCAGVEPVGGQGRAVGGGDVVGPVETAVAGVGRSGGRLPDVGSARLSADVAGAGVEPVGGQGRAVGGGESGRAGIAVAQGVAGAGRESAEGLGGAIEVGDLCGSHGGGDLYKPGEPREGMAAEGGGGVPGVGIVRLVGLLGLCRPGEVSVGAKGAGMARAPRERVEGLAGKGIVRLVGLVGPRTPGEVVAAVEGVGGEEGAAVAPGPVAEVVAEAGLVQRRWWRVAAARAAGRAVTPVPAVAGGAAVVEEVPAVAAARAAAVTPVPAVAGGAVVVEEVPAVAAGSEEGVAGGPVGVGRGVALGFGGGGLAYADCLATLDRRRRAQQERRRWGRHIPLPVAPLDADERELRHGADGAAADLVEVALRAAAAGAGPDGLLPIERVEATADHVVLALAGQETAPPGFLDVHGPPGSCLWTTGADREELEAAAARVLPPFPLVAPLGRTTSGRERLVDLEAAGLTTVDGPPDDVAGLLRATVVAMATASWCTPLRIVAVGLERDLAALPGVDVVDGLDVALTFAEAHVHQVTAALVATGDDVSLGGVRARGLSTAASGALLVVSTRPPDDPVVGQRVAALAGPRPSGIGVLLRRPPSPEEAGPVAAGRSLRIDGDGALHDGDGALHDSVDGAGRGEPVWARRLDAAEARRLVELLAVADRRDDGHAEVRPRRAVRDGDPTTNAEPDLLVRVLGAVGIAGLDPAPAPAPDADSDPDPDPDADADPDHHATAVEVLAYLALREASVTHATVEAALFPDGAPGPHAVDRHVTAAAELVGPGRVRRPTPGRYAVSERVATDHGLLCDLVARADDALTTDDLDAATDHLTAALALVRGVPLDGPGRRYAWAGPAREAIVAQVVDAADSLAGLQARRGD